MQVIWYITYQSQYAQFNMRGYVFTKLINIALTHSFLSSPLKITLNHSHHSLPTESLQHSVPTQTHTNLGGRHLPCQYVLGLWIPKQKTNAPGGHDAKCRNCLWWELRQCWFVLFAICNPTIP